MSPARAAVGLVTDVVDDGLALGPLGTSIEGGWDIIVDNHGRVTSRLSDSPVRVDNGTEHALDLLERSTSELIVVASNPVGLRVGINGLDVSRKIERLLLTEEVENVTVLAEGDPLAAGLGLAEVNEILVLSKGRDALSKLGEGLVKLVELDVAALGSVLDGRLAKLADVVVLSEELMDTRGAGDSSEDGESESAHSDS